MGQPSIDITESMLAGVLILNQDWSLRFANEQARHLFDCMTTDELIAQWNQYQASMANAAASVVAENETGGRFQWEYAVGERTRRLMLLYFPIEQNGAPQHLFLGYDRDSMELLETTLRLATRQQALTSLHMSIAHDLKAPLNALAINLDLLKTSLGKMPEPDPMQAERRQRYLKVLTDELARLNRSLQTLLNQAIPPEDGHQTFDLRDLLLDLVSLIAPQAKKQIVAMEVQLGEQSLSLEGQRDILKQALLNIAVNALEVMPGGGRLSVRLETRMGRAIVSFQDTGPGIAPEMADKIWQMHYSTKKTGAGIGLYVSRSMIESFGGEVHVDSRAGHGACFSISLPIMPKEADH